MKKSEVQEIVNSEIKKFINSEMDKEMKKILGRSTQSRTEIINTIKNAMEAVYKVLWQKRDFWKTDIK